MNRFIIFAAATLAPFHAYAACDNYTDGTLSMPAPAVELCFKGSCETTTLSMICGNVSGAGAAYANGWGFRSGENALNGWLEVEAPDGEMVDPDDYSAISCEPIGSDDPDACSFPNAMR